MFVTGNAIIQMNGVKGWEIIWSLYSNISYILMKDDVRYFKYLILLVNWGIN